MAFLWRAHAGIYQTTVLTSPSQKCCMTPSPRFVTIYAIDTDQYWDSLEKCVQAVQFQSFSTFPRCGWYPWSGKTCRTVSSTTVRCTRRETGAACSPPLVTQPTTSSLCGCPPPKTLITGSWEASRSWHNCPSRNVVMSHVHLRLYLWSLRK